ncbi:MAG: JAB domain-containing protein [Acetobacter sp.]|jgi:DNA repair protein RadC
MRERVVLRGADSLADYEILEMLLYFGIARRDTKPLAKALINHFGSLPGVLKADETAFAVADFPSVVFPALELVRKVASCIAGSDPRERLTISDWPALESWMETARKVHEKGQLRLLFLDNRNRLIADECPHSSAGDENIGRVVMRQALRLQATALIGVRLATEGMTAEETALREMRLARELSHSGRFISVILHDYITLDAQGWVSFRQRNILQQI